MTDQHPLTDEMCENIAPMAQWAGDIGDIVFHHCDMRAAADWQLEQVIECLKSQEAFLGSLYYNKTTGVIAIDFESIECSLRQAMRPTQEDN